MKTTIDYTNDIGMTSLFAHNAQEAFLFDNNAKKQFLSIIENAKGKLFVGAYKLQKNQLPTEDILEVLNIVTKKGIPTKIIVESRITSEEMRGYTKLPVGAALQAFKDTGVQIITDLKEFANVHLKILLTEEMAVVGTTNFDDSSNDAIKRDIYVVTKEKEILNELEYVLGAVETGKKIEWPIYKVDSIKENQSKLSWAVQFESHAIEMIKSAKYNIECYQQDIQHNNIVDALIVKTQAGINFRLLMSKYPFGQHNPNKNIDNLQKLLTSGAHIRLTGEKVIQDGLPLHIHGKVLIIDGEVMAEGSINFNPDVLNPDKKQLNLMYITKNSALINPVKQLFEKDWQDHEGCDFNGSFVSSYLTEKTKVDINEIG